MKKLLQIILVLASFITIANAQPQKITYQAVVRDANNALIANTTIGIRVTLYHDSINNGAEYVETHTAITNHNALVTIEIGAGTPMMSNNTIADIDWKNHRVFLKIEIDPTGGTNYTISGIQEFLTVPYAFYAETTSHVDTALYANNSGNAINAVYADTALFLMNAQNSDTAKFAYHSDTALYSTNSNHSVYADTALYANNSGNAINAVNAVYADTALFLMNAQNSDTAKFAYHSDTANYTTNSNHSIYADTALYANNSGNAINAVNAVYADTALFLMNAQNSDTAKFAYLSDTANYTTNSNHSVYADTALYANNSGNALNAVNAIYTDTALYANNANNSINAVNAINATHSDTANYSNNSTNAINATYADTADYNKLLNKPAGINKGDILYWETNDNTWHIVPAGNSGEVLTMGSNNVPHWSAGVTQFALPTVTTVAVNNIHDSSATCDGSITADGGFPVIAYGVCWSTAKNPTLNNSHTFDGSGVQNWSSVISGLSPAVTYYARAYATNGLGTAYGDTIGFTTPALPPTVITTLASNLTSTTATTGGNVTFAGGLTVTERGVCWNTTGNPTMADNHIASGSGLGAFTITLTALTPATTYYIRAYAINSHDTAYGNEDTITTLTLPTVLTAAVSNVYVSTATCGGNVTDDGGATVTARGVCWSTTLWPTTADSHTTDGTGAGSFISSITGLNASTKYYVRAYATNSVGTAYGDTISFTTIGMPPTVTTTAASSVTGTSAVTGGNVISDGGVPVTARGVCWNTTGNPTMADNVIASGSGTGSFSVNMTGLSGTTTYYVKAYAINLLDTAYGSTINFTTLNPWTCGVSTIKDTDNNVYNTVQLGTQCWMKENLRTTRYANGSTITLITSTVSSTTNKYRYYPGNNINNVATYGYLYNWAAVMNGAASSSANPSGIQGLCPNGWHTPSTAEYNELLNYVSNQSQYLCNSNSSYRAKALASANNWTSSSTTCAIGKNLSANNATGFSLQPAGYYEAGQSVKELTNAAVLWTVTNHDYYYSSNSSTDIVHYSSGSVACGYSVRCIKD